MEKTKTIKEFDAEDIRKYKKTTDSRRFGTTLRKRNKSRWNDHWNKVAEENYKLWNAAENNDVEKIKELLVKEETAIAAINSKGLFN